jgi:c(7)-type cytochrome triheme protein
MMKTLTLIAPLALALAVAGNVAADSGKDVYTKACAVCHAGGIAAAPRFGNAGDWEPRIAGGMPRLYNSALKGTPKGMPAKGGNLTLPDADVRGAVDYMVAAAGGVKAAPAESRAETRAEPKKDVKLEPKKEGKPEPKAKPEVPVAEASAVSSVPITTVGASATDVNSFNRLLKPPGKRNLPPPEDGIHDPSNDGTHALQPPLAAFGSLPKSFAGNRVNWVEALGTKKIKPRWDKSDPAAEAVVMDMNIVREVKGSMPDVVYPHKQHTEWLDCSNCHPAIFTPQKGSNAISMAAILLGEKCGVCHGKVAFPVSECRLCHSKKKDVNKPAQAATK